MKKIITLFIGLIGFGFINAQQVPNYSFEDWKDFTFYKEPLNWNTGNQVTYGLGVVGITRDENSYHGNYCARIETLEILNTIAVPGLLTLAEFTIDLQNFTYTVSGGIPLHDRVTELDGMYRYEGADDDSAAILIYNFKNDGSTFDTIGYGFVYLHDASQWTPFQVNMVYQNNHTPDTLNIAIFSSTNAELQNVGSVLWVDSLVLHTYTGVFNLSAGRLPVSVYPNPAADKVTFETAASSENRKVQITDRQGRTVSVVPFTSKKITVNSEHFSPGVYFYKITVNDRMAGSGKFVKR